MYRGTRMARMGQLRDPNLTTSNGTEVVLRGRSKTSGKMWLEDGLVKGSVGRGGEWWRERGGGCKHQKEKKHYPHNHTDIKDLRLRRSFKTRFPWTPSSMWQRIVLHIAPGGRPLSYQPCLGCLEHSSWWCAALPCPSFGGGFTRGRPWLLGRQ